MILETERLILRPWEERDAESLYEYARDDRVGPSAGWKPHSSVEESREVIRCILSGPETFAVCLRNSDRPIGSIGVMIGSKSNLSLPDTDGEIGYWIGVPFWGQGLIPEAVREIIRYSFKDLSLVNLWCGNFEGNEKSKRVQEKCGFKYHHTNKDVYWKAIDTTLMEHVSVLSKEGWLNTFEIRHCDEKSIPDLLGFAWKIFSEYESPIYSKEGTEEFWKCIHDEDYLKGISYYGAYYNGKLIGEIGIRLKKCHICFFFVDGKYQRMGIGTRLFEKVKEDLMGKDITLNSSPVGLPFYLSLGFLSMDSEQVVNGIRFTPMKYICKK